MKLGQALTRRKTWEEWKAIHSDIDQLKQHCDTLVQQQARAQQLTAAGPSGSGAQVQQQLSSNKNHRCANGATAEGPSGSGAQV